MKPGNLKFLNLLNYKLQCLDFEEYNKQGCQKGLKTENIMQKKKKIINVQSLCDQLCKINMKPGNLKFLNLLNFKLQSLDFEDNQVKKF